MVSITHKNVDFGDGKHGIVFTALIFTGKVRMLTAIEDSLNPRWWVHWGFYLYKLLYDS